MAKKEYSLDLRERVIEKINQGSSYEEVSLLFRLRACLQSNYQ